MLAMLMILVSSAAHSPAGGTCALPGPVASGAPTVMRQDRAQETRQPARAAGMLVQRGNVVLEDLLTEIGRDGRRGAGIDSLLRAHPELRALILRKLLTPDEPATLAGTASLFTPEGWRLEGNSPMTPFERSALIKSRQMILHDRWTENRVLAPQVDVLGTVLWLLSLVR